MKQISDSSQLHDCSREPKISKEVQDDGNELILNRKRLMENIKIFFPTLI